MTMAGAAAVQWIGTSTLPTVMCLLAIGGIQQYGSLRKWVSDKLMGAGYRQFIADGQLSYKNRTLMVCYDTAYYR